MAEAVRRVARALAEAGREFAARRSIVVRDPELDMMVVVRPVYDLDRYHGGRQHWVREYKASTAFPGAKRALDNTRLQGFTYDFPGTSTSITNILYALLTGERMPVLTSDEEMLARFITRDMPLKEYFDRGLRELLSARDREVREYGSGERTVWVEYYAPSPEHVPRIEVVRYNCGETTVYLYPNIRFLGVLGALAEGRPEAFEYLCQLARFKGSSKTTVVGVLHKFREG